MINNNISPVITSKNLDLINVSEYDNNEPVTDETYIEIPEHITNFEQLLSYMQFVDIKRQYQCYVIKLADLYNYFTDASCNTAKLNTASMIKSSVNNLKFQEENRKEVNDKALFYSYKTIRRAIYKVVTYLLEAKNQVAKDETAIVINNLAECLDICLDGFNSKIILLSDYIEYFNSDTLEDKINIRLKNLMQAKISEYLISTRRYINIHHQTAVFNLIAADYGFESFIDRYANLYSYNIYAMHTTIAKIKQSMSAFDICKIIVDECYKLFKELLIKTDKSHWLINDTIKDFTNEYAKLLEDFFIEPLNRYFAITDSRCKLSIRDIILLQEDSYSLLLADIKDVFYVFVAKNINKFSKIIPNITYKNDTIAVIDNDLVIKNINNCYFYILKNNQQILPLKFKYLIDESLTKIDKNIYTAIFIQSLEQDKSIEDISNFFNSVNIDKLFFNNQQLLVRLIGSVEFKEILINSIVYCRASKDNGVNYKLCVKFVKKNIFTTEILRYLIEFKINYFFSLVSIFPADILSKYILSLNYNAIKKIINNLTKQNVVHCLQQAFYLLFENYRWSLLDKILTSKLKFAFFNYLTESQQLKSLKILINNNKYNIITYFLLDYIKYEIINNENKNIMHLVIINNDVELLTTMLNQLPVNSIKLLLTTQEIKREDIYSFRKHKYTPLMLAIAKSNLAIIDLLIPFCDEKIIAIKNSNDDNALMLAVEKNNVSCFQQLIKKSTINILTVVNCLRENILRLAIIKKHHDITEIILDNLNDNVVLKLLKQIDSSYLSSHDNVLGLAIKSKNPHLNKIISKADTDAIMHCNKYGHNIFMIAAKYGISDKDFSLLVTRCRTHNIYKVAYNVKKGTYENALTIATINGHANVIKNLLEYNPSATALNSDLYYDINVAALAIKCKHLPCLQELLKNATRTNLIGDNILYDFCLLEYAFFYKFPQSIKLLVEKYIQLLSKNEFKDRFLSAIDAASRYNSLSCLEQLLALTTIETLTSTTKNYKYNSLMISIYNNNIDCMRTILHAANTKGQKEVLLQQKNQKGDNSLMMVVKYHRIKFVNEILNHAIESLLLATDNKGDNCLMIAIKYNDYQIFSAILEKANRAVLLQRNSDGYDAMQLAKKVGNKYYDEIKNLINKNT